MHGADGTSRQAETAQQWNAAQYAANGRFVADLATEVMALLAPRSGERILDLGCGDGHLSQAIAAAGAHVLACDKDPSMLAAAAARGLRTVAADMTDLPFQAEFDAVFSNAALHWTREQDAVLARVYRALVPGGRFVAEMGGLGNIASIRVALQAVLESYGIDAEERAASFFPSQATYTRLLEQHGFTVVSMRLVPRPTRIANGMAAWLQTFRSAVLHGLTTEDQRSVIARTVALLAPVLQDSDGTWWADYVRLRFSARRQD